MKPLDWKAMILERTQADDPLNAATEVTISQPVDIYTETRLFVVDGDIVTFSQYKRGNKVHYSVEMVDPEVLAFGRECLGEWRPNGAFVLDIAQTPIGCQIVEVNCINAAGFYACDTMKLAVALEDFVEKR